MERINFRKINIIEKNLLENDDHYYYDDNESSKYLYAIVCENGFKILGSLYGLKYFPVEKVLDFSEYVYKSTFNASDGSLTTRPDRLLETSDIRLRWSCDINFYHFMDLEVLDKRTNVYIPLFNLVDFKNMYSDVSFKVGVLNNDLYCEIENSVYKIEVQPIN